MRGAPVLDNKRADLDLPPKVTGFQSLAPVKLERRGTGGCSTEGNKVSANARRMTGFQEYL